LNKQSKSWGRSEDRDILSQRVRGLEAAQQLMDQQFTVVKEDPRNNGHIPLKALEFGGEARGTIVGDVADMLMRYSEAGILRYKGRTITLRERQQAVEVAEMAMKVFSADMRSSEHYEETPAYGEKAEDEAPEQLLRSPFADGIAKAMNPVKELIRRFGMMGESVEVIDRFKEEMDTNAQDGMVTQTDQNKVFAGTFVTRFAAFTGIWSNWRGLGKATERLRKMGLGLGLEIYHEKDTDKKAKLWKKVAPRLPSRMATFFPTLAWEWKQVDRLQRQKARQGEQPLHDGRWTRNDGEQYQELREGIVEDIAGLKRYAELRADTSKDVEDFKDEMEDRVEPKKMRDPVRIMGAQIMGERSEGIIKTEQERYERIERRRQLEISKQEKKRAFIWMVGERYASEPDFPQRPDLVDGYNDFTDAEKLERWDEWEERVFERWNGRSGVRGKLLLLERKAFLDYRDKAFALERELGRKFDEDDPRFKNHPAFQEMQGDYDVMKLVERIREGETIAGLTSEDFSDADLELVKRLTNLGGTDEGAREAGAKHLAEQDLVMAPFLEDVDFSLTEFAKTGGDAVPARRYNDGKDATVAVLKMSELLANLGKYEDKLNILGTNRQLVEDLVEYRNLLKHVGIPARQKHTRVLATMMVKDFFAADEWVEGGEGLGAWFGGGLWGLFKDFRIPVLGRPALSSSVAQRRLGSEALSWTTGQKYRFIQKLAAHVGREEAQKMEEFLEARGRDMYKAYAKQWLVPGLGFYGAYGLWQWGSGFAKLSWETIKQVFQETAQS
jgi:hypothetical protein